MHMATMESSLGYLQHSRLLESNVSLLESTTVDLPQAP